MSVFFNGQLLVTPQTASAVNDDAMLNRNLSVTNSAAFVGECTGGKPLTVLSFGNPDDARRVLGEGDLCDAVVKAFAPSSETGAAGTVYAVRVNKAFQAFTELAVEPGHLNDTGVFGVISGNTWSREDLKIQVEVEQGTQTDYRTLTISGVEGGIPWSKTAVDINASRVHLNVLEDDCTLVVTNGSTEFLHIQLDNSAVDGQVISVPVGAYNTLGELEAFLLTLTNKAGKPVYTMAFDDDEDRHLSVKTLDRKAYTTKNTYSVFMTMYQVEKWFKDNVPQVTFERGSADPMTFWKGPKVTATTYLTAKPALAPDVNDWNTAFELLQHQDIQWVTPLSDNDEYHAIATAHVQFCSNYLKRERRTIIGMGTGVSDADAITYASKLNSDRVSLVHLGHYNYDSTGKLALRPAYMTAALISAAFAGVNPGTPLTNKSLAVMGWERNLLNPTDTDKLLLGGVLPVEKTETGYKVVQSISTWRVDSKYNKREQSCGVAVDFAVRNVRQAVDPLRGQKQTPILLSRAVSITKGTLTELSRPEPQGPAVLVGDENSPAFRNVTATIEGDVLRIQFEASPAIPNNYILVTMYAVPYSGSATA